jgi:hypothetical protein
MLVKAIAGGGGRGIRAVRAAADLDEAFARCASEAAAAFGDGACGGRGRRFSSSREQKAAVTVFRDSPSLRRRRALPLPPRRPPRGPV